MRRLLITVLLCGTLPVTAHANNKVMVLPVVPIAGEVGQAPADRMTRSLLTELRQQSDLVVVEGKEPGVAVTGPDTGRRPAKSIAAYQRALDSLKQGARHAERLRFPQAIRALREGISGLENNLDLLEDYDRLLDAYVLLAVAYFRRGKQAAGTDVLQRLARMRPEYELDASAYPPVFVSEYNEGRKRALERPRGALKITSAPEGAEVFLNGRSFGKTPLLVEQIVPGEHHLVVRVGEHAWGKPVEVREGETGNHHADLGAGGPDAPVTMGDVIAANRFDAQVRKTARSVARGKGADYVLVAAMGIGDQMYIVASYLGHVRSGRWALMNKLAPDLDMLSETIEAHNLAREIGRRIQDFDATVNNETQPFIPGKPMRGARRGSKLQVRRVNFIPPNLTVAAVTRSRVPVRASEPANAKPEAVASVASGTSKGGTAATGRRPVGQNTEPGEEGGTDASAKVAKTGSDGETPKKKPRGPLTRKDAGPIVSADAGVEDQESLTDATVKPEAEVAAFEVGSGPLAITDLSADADMAYQESFYETWWFWSAVAVVAAAGTGGATYYLLSGREPDSVRIRSVW